MGKALYRKHRPKKLDDIIGQEHITATLAKAIKTGRVSHAYLLTGPRGTGKTSIARILAHEVNNLPYDDESIHLDIIEIDAASNRRIDEIRELKERVNIAPTSAKYKVYIIDEVHMLTREAFNALLKTLEEPPQHAIFILATTEAHKLPDTIISRTQRFSLRPIELEKVAAQLKLIAKTENIEIDDDALEIIAQHGNGSFRDSLSLLDQMSNSTGHITNLDVKHAIGQAPIELIETMLVCITNHDAKVMSDALNQAIEQGIQPTQLSEQLSAEVRKRLLNGKDQPNTTQLLNLAKELLSIPSSRNPQIALELALYSAMLIDSPTHAKPAVTSPAPPRPPQTTLDSAKTVRRQSHTIVSAETDASSGTKNEENPSNKTSPVAAVRIETEASDMTDNPTEGDWKEILDAVKIKHNTLYGIARMASPQFSPGHITLVFGFPFHYKRVSDAKNHEILRVIAKQVTGQALKLTYELDTNTKPPTSEVIEPSPAIDISPITEIFGDAEVLEQ